MSFTDDQIQRFATRLGKEAEAWLRERSVERHYSAASAAEMLEVSERTVWGWVEAYEASAGRDGLGPVVKLSHKCVRIPSSALNRMLKRHTVDAAALASGRQAA